MSRNQISSLFPLSLCANTVHKENNIISFFKQAKKYFFWNLKEMTLKTMVLFSSGKVRISFCFITTFFSVFLSFLDYSSSFDIHDINVRTQTVDRHGSKQLTITCDVNSNYEWCKFEHNGKVIYQKIIFNILPDV